MKKLRFKAALLVAALMLGIFAGVSSPAVSAAGDEIVYRFLVEGAKVVAFSGKLTFPTDKLTVSSIQVYDGNEDRQMQSNSSNGVISFNATDSADVYDFTTETAMLTVSFLTKDGVTSSYIPEVSMNVEEFFTKQQATTKANTPFDYTATIGSNLIAAGHTDISTPSNSYVTSVNPLKFSGVAPELKGDISMKYSVDYNYFTSAGGYTNPYVVFKFTKTDGTVTTRTVSAYTTNSSAGKRYYTYSGITPYELNGTLTATLYAKHEGKLYSSKESSPESVKSYAEYYLGVYNAKNTLTTLLVDMLNYGAATQTYINYGLSSLANKDLTATQKTWASSVTQPSVTFDFNYSPLASATATWQAHTLNIRDGVFIRLKFAAPSSASNLRVKITSDVSGEEWYYPKSSLEDAGSSMYYITFRNIKPSQMDKNFYFTVMNGSTPISKTIKYNVASYIGDSWNDSDANLKSLIREMYRYGTSSYQYDK